MKSIKENLGLYSILIVLLYFLGLFLYQFKFGSPYWIQRTNMLFGPFAALFLILVIASIVSIFVNYKYNWIVISLPFISNLILPFTIPGSGWAYRGILINVVQSLIQGNITVFFQMLLGAVLPILIVTYLFYKNIKKVENKNFEIVSAVLILLFFIINLL